MKLSRIAVRRPITTIMFFAAIVMLGIVSLPKIPMQILPDISPPYGAAFCRVRDNMSVEEMERRIIMPIEGEIAQLPNVKNIRVFSSRWGCFFPIEFEFGTNVKYRIVDLQDRLDRFRRTFPKRSLFIDAFPFETSWFNKEFMDLVLKGPREDPYLERIDSERYRQRLQDIDGVAQAEIWGGKRRTVDVTILQDRLREFGVPLWRVINRVQSYANEPVFLGDIEEGDRKYFVRLDGQFGDTSEIEDVIVKGEGNIAVRHLGLVENTSHSRRWLRRVDGKPALGVDLEKEALVNPIELSRRAHRVIEQINEELPEGYELTVTWEVADEILDLLKELSKLALLGIILSISVLYLFIRNVRISLIICLVIPISIIAAFNAMYFKGMSINIISLIGLAVGIGTLIDSAIVVLENVFRHYERGRDPVTSAVVGSHEVGKAIFALTLTNVVVFLPIVFVEGQIRLTFLEGALAIIFPTVISMLVALTLVPMLTSRVLMVLDAKKALLAASGGRLAAGRWRTRMSAWKQKTMAALRRIPHPTMAFCRRRYGTILKSCLRHRVRFLIAVVLVVLYTYYYTMSGIQQDVLEAPRNEDSFEVFVYLPNGTKQDYTLQVVSSVEDLILKQVPEIKNLHSWIRDDSASLRVLLVDKAKRTRESTTIQEELRPFLENFATAEVTFNPTRTRGENETPPVETGSGGEIEIRGPEYNQINTLAENFAEILMQINGVRDVYNQSEPGPLEIQFHLDRDTAAVLQITPQLVAQSIQVAQRRGEYSTIQMKKGDEEIDIIFAQIEDPRDLYKKETKELEGIRFEELKQIPIFSPALGTTVPLEDIGTIQVRRGQSNIQRENRERIGRIRFETAPNVKYSEVETVIKELLKTYPVPAGYRMSLGGQSRQMDEMQKALWNILFLAVILLYMCIAALFESFSQPLVIMLAIPLALVGIVWIFLLTNTAFTEMAALGGIFLLGMLPNSAILMIHYSGYLRKEKHYPRQRAIMVSGYHRLRPIFMTVITAILGLIPMATGDEQWSPFALCVIGGLASSTILTLLIVPGFSFIVEDIAVLVIRMVRYVASWRWILVFWSRRRREQAWERMTAYRRAVPREEPLVVQIDHLTRIYPPSRLEKISARSKSLIQSLPVLSPAPGFLPVSLPSPAPSSSTRERTKALDMVSLTVEAGLFGLLGPNGAGKTTLLRLIAGIDQATRGYLSICGYDMRTEAKHARKLIGYLPQYFGVYSDMTAYHYLDYFALLKGIRRAPERREAIYRALDMVNLSDQVNVPVGQFSGGMMRRIGLAQILVRPPKVLIVDEPTVGLDPLERVRFRNMLVRLSQDRVVILSTHIVEDVAHSCRTMALMDEGRILFTGRPEELVQSVRGKVWEFDLAGDSAWRELRRRYKVASQSYTANGIRMRVIADSPPCPEAETVEPSLEDAYLYHTRIQMAPDTH